MKCQSLLSRKNKKNIDLSSAAFAQRVVKLKVYPFLLYSIKEEYLVIILKHFFSP